ncbi:MAG: hypothetical protein QOJ56_5842 [Mycobacterium sp.]|nr:hypothetical protein [Mycobacterium sp.]
MAVMVNVDNFARAETRCTAPARSSSTGSGRYLRLRRSVGRKARRRASWRANNSAANLVPPVRRHSESPPAGSDSRRGRRAAALLLLLHGIELIGLVIAAGVTTRLARSHPGHGAGLPTLMVLAAMALVGWQGYRLLRGRWSLNVSGLAVQSAIVMAAVAVATQQVGPGGIGILVACAVLAGWGRLAKNSSHQRGRQLPDSGAGPIQCGTTAERAD